MKIVVYIRLDICHIYSAYQSRRNVAARIILENILISIEMFNFQTIIKSVLLLLFFPRTIFEYSDNQWNDRWFNRTVKSKRRILFIFINFIENFIVSIFCIIHSRFKLNLFPIYACSFNFNNFEYILIFRYLRFSFNFRPVFETTLVRD